MNFFFLFQGYTVGGDFHELRTIIEHVKDKTRVGVCLDTCHAHAAGRFQLKVLHSEGMTYQHLEYILL